MMSNIVFKQTKSILLIQLVFFVGLASCRAPTSEEETDSDTYPEPTPEGRCPDGFSDQFDNSASPYLGGEQEVLIEVSISTDFHCPYCMLLALELDGFFENPNHLSYVRIYLHHFPLSQHPDSPDIHKATVATANQSMDKFWILHDEIFARESQDDTMTIEEVVEFAQDVLELDMEQFEADRISEETEDFILSDQEQASAQGLTGTPTVWVCGIKTSWPDLDEVVDYYLAGALD